MPHSLRQRGKGGKKGRGLTQNSKKEFASNGLKGKQKKENKPWHESVWKEITNKEEGLLNPQQSST